MLSVDKKRSVTQQRVQGTEENHLVHNLGLSPSVSGPLGK